MRRDDDARPFKDLTLSRQCCLHDGLCGWEKAIGLQHLELCLVFVQVRHQPLGQSELLVWGQRAFVFKQRLEGLKVSDVDAQWLVEMRVLPLS